MIPDDPQKNSRREGNPIYTRNYGKADRSGVRYNPPPGYDGNAFSEPPTVKMHRAQDEILRLPQDEILRLPQEEDPLLTEDAEEQKPEPAEIRIKPPAEEEVPEPPEEMPVHAGSIQSLEALFRHLRGKFGREELMIVLVMLLVASDGASPELLLLALLLIAG